MEPRREEPKVPKPGAEVRPKRFRIIKLEERIAPKRSGKAGAGPDTSGTLSIE